MYYSSYGPHLYHKWSPAPAESLWHEACSLPSNPTSSATGRNKLTSGAKTALTDQATLPTNPTALLCVPRTGCVLGMIFLFSSSFLLISWCSLSFEIGDAYFYTYCCLLGDLPKDSWPPIKQFHRGRSPVGLVGETFRFRRLLCVCSLLVPKIPNNGNS